MSRNLFLLIALVTASWPAVPTNAQSEVAAEPIVGLRDNRPRHYALQHADVIVEPGQQIADATVLIEGTSITAVGKAIEIPAGFMTIDCTGKRIYPGLIDAWNEIDVPQASSQAAYWNSNVTPQRQAATVAATAVGNADKLRSQGFTARLMAPEGGIVKGSSCVVLLSDASPGRTLLQPIAWQHLQLTVPRGSGPPYPNSPMGAVALLRQSMHDANWYRAGWDAYRSRPQLPRPETNVALQALGDAISSQTFVVDAPNERMAVRTEAIAREFALRIILRGSGREYRGLDEIAAMNRPILVPVNFPATPDVKTSERARNTTLVELMHWDLAPENPARLAAAGVTFCLTTDGLEDVSQFRQQVRTAIERGLDPDTALAAVTTVPARLLGIDGQTGRIAPGMLANLVIADGEWFAKQTKILECWVAGEQFVTTAPPLPAVAQLAGRWLFELPVDGAKPSLQLELIEKDGKLSGTLGDASEPEADASPDKAAKKPAELRNVASERDRTTATIDLHAIDPQLPAGVAQLTLILLAGEQPEAGIVASIVLPDGQTVPLALRRAAAEAAPQTQEPGKGAPAEADDVTAPAAEAEAAEAVAAEVKTPAWFPLGAYGLEQRITEQPTVMFRGATVWTCDPSGVLESADVLIRDGLIAAVGPGLAVPAGCQIIDARGKHITPGLIDCHSHMGTDGGINESGQPVTAEVRIGDFIDNSDIQIYRQAAGGLTVANLLHGSANPIGGQNQVIKLRWGETMDGLRMREAPAGIKFALGENVKRNQARYPSTRMGVQQIIRDQLLAAREYQARWRDYRQGHSDGLPPRVDLQLEALAEVQRGQRWIHCHSYRQDEIVATLDLLEEFGITIGTLQHILEGYKVADRMARHGAMGSSFSDWWAYKFEVFDAIPYNGALMHDLGVVVSFNSDDRELARHLNTEAAKATKYGGVPEHEALQMVTLNPARQLRIDPYVGSLTVGKHADLVVWSGRPLSTLSRCEQTWIDGRRYFDLDSDQQLRQRDAELRARLIQKALATDAPDEKPGSKKVEEEERWVRHDIYCAAHGAARHDQGGQR